MCIYLSNVVKTSERNKMTCCWLGCITATDDTNSHALAKIRTWAVVKDN